MKTIHHKFFEGCDSFDFEKEQQILLQNLQYLKSLDIREYSFYKKWVELQKYKYNDAFKSKSLHLQKRIWKPTDIYNEQQTICEIEELNPRLEYIPEDNSSWDIMRVLCCTADYSSPPGRFLRFFVLTGDKDHPKYLGFIAVASDLASLGTRDDYIGWTFEDKMKKRKLVNSAVGHSIVPTQPFGYNFLGGKLCALLTTSKLVRNTWQQKYRDILVGMTTTSLYGPYSQYSGLKKWWKPCGETTGQIPIKMDDDIYKKWCVWLKENKSELYKKRTTNSKGLPASGVKMITMGLIFEEIGVTKKECNHGFNRGVFYSLFYENGKEFLQNKIDENKLVLKPLFDQSDDSVINYWKTIAIKRYKTLKQDGKLNNESLFYLDMTEMKYEESKTKFFIPCKV